MNTSPIVNFCLGSGISTNQFLSHVNLNVIPNSVCSVAFPFIVQPSNICTSGIGGVGTCGGDSGGPLVINRNNRNVLVRNDLLLINFFTR